MWDYHGLLQGKKKEEKEEEDPCIFI